jgi:hypothetical protein
LDKNRRCQIFILIINMGVQQPGAIPKAAASEGEAGHRFPDIPGGVSRTFSQKALRTKHKGLFFNCNCREVACLFRRRDEPARPSYCADAQGDYMQRRKKKAETSAEIYSWLSIVR